MKRAEREQILRQGIVLPETPRDRRQHTALEDDLSSSPLTGGPLRMRLRNFRVGADGYLASLGGPLPYMTRLREIDELTAAASEELEQRWLHLADEIHDDDEFARRWREEAFRVSFGEVNDLIERHNRWYPVESGLPMDPRTGDYALVNGENYRRAPLDGAWVLERCPADRTVAAGHRRARPTP